MRPQLLALRLPPVHIRWAPLWKVDLTPPPFSLPFSLPLSISLLSLCSQGPVSAPFLSPSLSSLSSSNKPPTCALLHGVTLLHGVFQITAPSLAPLWLLQQSLSKGKLEVFLVLHLPSFH